MATDAIRLVGPAADKSRADLSRDGLTLVGQSPGTLCGEFDAERSSTIACLFRQVSEHFLKQPLQKEPLR